MQLKYIVKYDILCTYKALIEDDIMMYIVFSVALLVIWGVATYNSFISSGNVVTAAWSDVDVQLKRRFNLIPKLVDVAKGYMGYEQKTLSEIVSLRSQLAQTSDFQLLDKLESSLTTKLNGFFALAENYPELKTNQLFLDLQANLTVVEDAIQMARRYYNGSVRVFNTLAESFPSVLIAKLFNFNKKDFFNIQDNEREVPAITF